MAPVKASVTADGMGRGREGGRREEWTNGRRSDCLVSFYKVFVFFIYSFTSDATEDFLTHFSRPKKMYDRKQWLVSSLCTYFYTQFRCKRRIPSSMLSKGSNSCRTLTGGTISSPAGKETTRLFKVRANVRHCHAGGRTFEMMCSWWQNKTTTSASVHGF